ncbi:beta-lactamase family protein [Permianibacter sp. IMCC34836]|uniref:serine hydrolase domain-containing protein n=1 Tax=Permianibacter fluminis TaxID=2738515 RepID=UPI0015542A70|nr:serine hydrolase domain-containing protein [Permianibacter fluminis]NQD35759.1 beta-lactamase family protein [Permianibacter fluminis]
MDRRKFLKSTVASLLAGSLPLPILAASGGQSLASVLSSIADQSIKEFTTPGIQISVWVDGIAIAGAMNGLSNLETGTVVSSSTIFRAGSITKQFTAALIARLHDKGLLSVNDRLDKHLGFFKGKDAPTLLELIHQTAGVHEVQGDSFSQLPITQIELAKIISDQNPLFDFQSGSSWLYSNANYILLGAVIESVTKQPLNEAARQHLFGPLKLAHTEFDHHSEVVKGRAAGYTGNEVDGTPFANADFIAIEQTGGAGAIRTTADDLCRWHYALLYGDFLSAESRQALLEPARLKDGRPITEGRFDPKDNNMGETSYGYGLMLDRSAKAGGVIAMHNGFVSGFSAYLATHVPSRTTVACMCNADPSQNLPFRLLRKAVFSASL